MLFRSPRTQGHGAGATTREGCPTTPFGDDVAPEQGVAQNIGEKSGVSTGQIDETSSPNEIGELWVVRLVAIRYGGYHTRDAERLRLRSSEFVPVRKTFFTVRHGRGRDLHKPRRSIFEKLLLEGAHSWQVFPRTNERD